MLAEAPPQVTHTSLRELGKLAPPSGGAGLLQWLLQLLAKRAAFAKERRTRQLDAYARHLRGLPPFLLLDTFWPHEHGPHCR